MEDYKVMDRPYTEKEIRDNIDENGTICGIVRVELDEIIENDFEGFLDILSERLIDSPCLMGTDYKIVGHEGDKCLHFRVMGQVELVVDEDDA